MNRKKLDEDALIDDLTAGSLTLTAVAARHDLSYRQLSRILAGESRPSIKKRLVLAARIANLDLRRTVAASMPELLRTHIRTAQGDGPEARRCREFLMKHHLGETLQPPDDEPTPEISKNSPTYRWRKFCRRLQKSAEPSSTDA